jgi:cytochrome c peroxidase
VAGSRTGSAYGSRTASISNSPPLPLASPPELAVPPSALVTALADLPQGGDGHTLQYDAMADDDDAAPAGDDVADADLSYEARVWRRAH